jgi:hypothetical protein
MRHDLEQQLKRRFPTLYPPHFTGALKLQVQPFSGDNVAWEKNTHS